MNIKKYADDFISEYSKKYDLRLGKSFDKERANCSWFTNVFCDWAKEKDLPVKVVYFDSDEESHTAPIINGKIIDFTIKQFTKNPNDDYKITSPEDYKKYGYDKSEILDKVPSWFTIRKADKKIVERMRIKKYNQFQINEGYKELEYVVEDGTNQMMYETSAIINLLVEKGNLRNYDEAADVIKTTLSRDTYNKLFGRYLDLVRDGFDLFNLFVTQVLVYQDLERMFTNVVVQEGSDLEDEYVVALEINGRKVLLLCSPERGNSIRIQDDKYTIKPQEVIEILRELCEIYNEKY
jgi:hypothetical protein